MARHDAEREGQYVDQLEPIEQCSFDRGRQHPLCTTLCQRLARCQIVLLVSLQPVDLAFDIPCSAYHLTTFTIITPFPDLDAHLTLPLPASVGKSWVLPRFFANRHQSRVMLR